jgi:hypothetical protein
MTNINQSVWKVCLALVYGNWQPSKIFFLLSVQSSLFTSYFSPESIECFIEAQAFSRSNDLAPRPPLPPLYHVSKLNQRPHGRPRKKDSLLTGEVGKGRAWIRIIRLQESLDLYKSFNDLCFSFFLLAQQLLSYHMCPPTSHLPSVSTYLFISISTSLPTCISFLFNLLSKMSLLPSLSQLSVYLLSQYCLSSLNYNLTFSIFFFLDFLSNRLSQCCLSSLL